MNSLKDFLTFIWALAMGYCYALGIINLIRGCVKSVRRKRKSLLVYGSSYIDHSYVETLFEYHFKRRGRIKPEIYTNRELSNISKAEADWMDKQMKEVKKEKLIDTFDEAEIIEETKDQQTKLE